MSRPRTVFVSEYVCSGAWPDDHLEGSLAAEGRAMLLSLIAEVLANDAASLSAIHPATTLTSGRHGTCSLSPVGERARERGPADGLNVKSATYHVRTTWDDRLGEFPWHEFSEDERTRLTVISLARSKDATPETELTEFGREVANADAVFVIAPEFFSILEARTRDVERLAPGRLVGCSSDAVRLCADKLKLAEFLRAIDVPTIETQWFDLQQPIAAFPLPMVIKPRDGAGSTLTFRVDSDEQLAEVAATLRISNEGFEFIQQPFISGRSLSGAAVVKGTGLNRTVSVLPTGEQLFSDDGLLQFRGVEIPGSVTRDEHLATEQIIRQCCDAIPGLNAYVGFDLISSNHGVQLTEINPRLTTGYVERRKRALE
ncbi:MAG: ATP-grasp domain-containing protein [Planctomycetota bacterium]|jgi:predicted ATP-grasp superfamily ATP-dependent carboligase